MRVSVAFGDLQAPTKIIHQVIQRLVVVLEPKLVKICEEYRDEVATFKHAAHREYPHFEEVFGEILRNATKENGNIVIEIQGVGNRIKFHVKVFSEDYLDAATATERGSYWRYFEDGTPGVRAHGSDIFGFIPTGENKGFMSETAKKKHPGVLATSVMYLSWAVLRENFIEKIREAVAQAIREI